MNLFKEKDKLPRIAYKRRRNGKVFYYIETYQTYEHDSYYSQDSEEVYSYEEAEKLLKEISDKEIIETGYFVNKEQK